MDFPIKNGGSFHCYVSSPEGINHSHLIGLLLFYPQSKYILHVRSQCCSAIGWRCFILGSIARKCRWNVHLVLVTYSNHNRTQLSVRSQPVVCGYNHTWLVVWNMNFMTFHILGMPSSQLTNSYFSEGVGISPATNLFFWGGVILMW